MQYQKSSLDTLLRHFITPVQATFAAANNLPLFQSSMRMHDGYFYCAGRAEQHNGQAIGSLQRQSTLEKCTQHAAFCVTRRGVTVDLGQERHLGCKPCPHSSVQA